MVAQTPSKLYAFFVVLMALSPAVLVPHCLTASAVFDTSALFPRSVGRSPSPFLPRPRAFRTLVLPRDSVRRESPLPPDGPGAPSPGNLVIARRMKDPPLELSGVPPDIGFPFPHPCLVSSASPQ